MSTGDTPRRAILHFDGDCFFASVEQAMNYKLRGLPVITGAERGAATALSIEAKRLGLSRGMSMKEIRQKCPSAVVVRSDYTSYSLYAQRMYKIVRRYTARVEEYSIDECFADITGLDLHYGMSYESLALSIKNELESSLGITFGVGLAESKVVAKIASKHNKPAGLTVVWRPQIPLFLKDMRVGNVWGIGFSMTIRLRSLGVETALDFAQKSEGWLKEQSIARPYREIWYELNGGSVGKVVSEPRADVQSIMKTRTFAPPTKDRALVWAQLSKNVERACARARARGVRTREVGVTLKSQEFLYRKQEVSLVVPTANPSDILRQIEKAFAEMFVPNILYRATGISLRDIVRHSSATLDLFGVTELTNERGEVLGAVDRINSKYGGHTVCLASTLQALQQKEPDRLKSLAKRPWSMRYSLEQKKKTVDLPFLGTAS